VRPRAKQSGFALVFGRPISQRNGANPVEVIRKLAGDWPDRELAVSLNRMRCKTSNGESWTTVRVREMRERLGIAEFDQPKLMVR